MKRENLFPIKKYFSLAIKWDLFKQIKSRVFCNHDYKCKCNGNDNDDNNYPICDSFKIDCDRLKNLFSF